MIRVMNIVSEIISKDEVRQKAILLTIQLEHYTQKKYFGGRDCNVGKSRAGLRREPVTARRVCAPPAPKF